MTVDGNVFKMAPDTGLGNFAYYLVGNSGGGAGLVRKKRLFSLGHVEFEVFVK